jgi:hypothetical protein
MRHATRRYRLAFTARTLPAIRNAHDSLIPSRVRGFSPAGWRKSYNRLRYGLCPSLRAGSMIKPGVRAPGNAPWYFLGTVSRALTVRTPTPTRFPGHRAGAFFSRPLQRMRGFFLQGVSPGCRHLHGPSHRCGFYPQQSPGGLEKCCFPFIPRWLRANRGRCRIYRASPATAPCVAPGSGFLLRPASSIPGRVPPASDRQGGRKCRRIAGAIPALQP